MGQPSFRGRERSAPGSSVTRSGSGSASGGGEDQEDQPPYHDQGDVQAEPEVEPGGGGQRSRQLEESEQDRAHQ
jgi:hypothetical protein